MKNETKIRVPKKYQPMLEIIEKDADGYWAYSKPGYRFSIMECHTAHETNQNDLLEMIRTMEPCDCEECMEALAKQSNEEADSTATNDSHDSEAVANKETMTMNKKTYTLDELQALPTLAQGQTDDLKVDDGFTRIWLSRLTVEDGAECDHMVTVEKLINGAWKAVEEYNPNA